MSIQDPQSEGPRPEGQRPEGPGAEGPRLGDDAGYNENLAEANAAEFGDTGAPLILSALAEGVASSAADPEDAMTMCRDIAAAEELSDGQFDDLVALVEGINDWELPREG